MALVYNQPAFAQKLLDRYKTSPPTFSIDYYDDHWLLNKAPTKFLYTQPFSSLLDDVNALRIPVDFIETFASANVPYYEGCMIVENIDHRRPRTHHQQSPYKEPESVRVVLYPTTETLYADLCLLNAQHGNTWTDMEALEIEAQILNAIIPPLHLDPDPHYGRVVNSVIQATTTPETVLRKRKLDHEAEENEDEKAKRTKLWSQYMHPRHGKSSISQKRSLFDTLGDIATKNPRGVYVLKHKPERPPKKEIVPVAQPSSSATAQAQVATTPVSAPAAPLPAVPPFASPPHDDLKLRSTPTTVVKHIPELPSMTNGKPKPVNGQPMTAASPVPEQHRTSVPPAANRTPVPTGAVLANSPTPVPQYPQQIPPPQPPTASPRPPTLPVNIPQVVNKPKPVPSVPVAPPIKQEDHHLPASAVGVQAAQSHPNPPSVVQGIPLNVSAQWQQFLANQKHSQLQHPLPQQTIHSQPQVKPQLPPQLPTQSPHPPQASPRPQTQPPLPVPQTQPATQPQPQKKQPTPHPPQAVGYPPQAPLAGFANRPAYPQNMYKPPGVAAQTSNLAAQRSSPLAHPAQQPISHGQSPHLTAQQTPQTTAAGTPMQSHTMNHPNQWSLQQQQAAAARYLQSQQAAAVAHHPQGLPQHGHPITQQQHHPQQQNIPRPAQGHDPSQQAMVHAQMRYNTMYPYQAMHAGMMNGMNGMRIPPNTAAQNSNAQYMAQAWRAAQAGRGGGAPMGTIPMTPQYQQQMLAAMRAQQQQQQQQQQQPIQQQAQVPQGTQR